MPPRSSLIDRLAAAESAHSGADLGVARTARMILGWLLAGAVAGGVISAAMGWGVIVLLALAAVGALSAAYLLAGAGRARAAIIVGLTAITVAVATSAALWEGIHSVAFAMLPVLLVIAGLLLGRRTMAWLTLQAMGLALAVCVLRLALGLEAYDRNVPGDLALLLLTIGLAGVVGHHLSRQISDSLRRVKESEARLRRIFQNTQDVYFEMQPDGTILEISPSASQLLGADREKLIGLSLVRFYTEESEQERLVTALRDRGRITNHALGLRDALGNVRHVLLTAALQVDLEHGEQRIAGSMRDVTERRQLEEHLGQARKMESLGTLAGGIAHDFNNLLTVINGHCELGRVKLRAGRDPSPDIEAVHAAGRKAADLTRKLLAFSRKEAHQPRVVAVDGLLGQMAPMLRTLTGEDIRLEIQVAPDTPRVQADPGQLEQVLINLVANARDAINHKGDAVANRLILIRAGRVIPDVPEGLDLAPGPHLMLEVSDTGEGMDQAVRERIFEPFFSTKKQGTGLGLATVYGVVRQNAGNIQVESAPGRGATFRIYWPATEQMPEGTPGQGPPRVGGSEGVLLVEDDAHVRTFAREALTELGFRVIEVSNGKEALQQLERCYLQVGLVISDVVMPEMDGKELSRVLRERYPHLRVLFVSGYPEDRLSHGGVLDPGIQLLAKPYSAAELARAVRTALDQP